MSDRWQPLGDGEEYQGIGWRLLMDTENLNRFRLEVRNADEGNWRHKTVTFK